MGELLFAILEVIADGLLEIAGEAIFALAARGFRAICISPRTLNAAISALIYITFGLMAGWVSVVISPHPLVRPSKKFHGMSLLISPLLAASVMSLIGSALRRKGRQTTQIETFGYAFAFAFAMALIRLIFVK
jgi:hypothetical protein